MLITHRAAFFALSVVTSLLMVPLAALAAPFCTLTVSPTVIVPGRGFTITLQSASSGIVTGTVNNGIGVLTVGVPKTAVSIAQTTTYTATVSNSEGTGTCTATVTVDPYATPEIPGAAGAGGGGGGGASPAQTMQGLGQLMSGMGQLLGALGGSNAVNETCLPRVQIDGCGCGRTRGSNGCRSDAGNRQLCPCQNTTNGFVTSGQCMAAGRCLGQRVGGGQGPLGGQQQGLGGAMQGLGSILQGLSSLMGGGGAGGGGGAMGGVGANPYANVCMTQYYYSQTQSADPCAIYQPGVSGDLGGNVTVQPNLVSDLLNSLGTGSGETGGGTSTPSREDTLSGTTTGSLQDSLFGDVRLGSAGATIYANVRRGLTEVAGFFGGNTFGGTSHSALARLCSARPWAGNGVFASLTPDGFFDALCRRAGYEPGAPLPAGGGGGGGGGRTTSNTSFNAGGQLPVSTTTVTVIPPEADIRAEPASVRLGARTYIFWFSRGVSSCAVRGPSFEQNSLTGAGATVPITGPTTFTIECVASGNASTTVRDSVTVNLAI